MKTPARTLTCLVVDAVDESVCVYYCRTYDKAVCGPGGGRGTVKDICYEVRRDLKNHHGSPKFSVLRECRIFNGFSQATEY